MERYYVNKAPQWNGDHEIHKERCTFLSVYRELVGEFESCFEAVKEAKENHFVRSNGCLHCCRECHSQNYC